LHLPALHKTRHNSPTGNLKALQAVHNLYSIPVYRMPKMTRWLLVCLSLLLSACSTVDVISTAKAVADAALEKTGLKKPELPPVPESQLPPRRIAMRLHAGDNLNTDAAGRPLALLVKIYKLKNAVPFQQASFDTMLSSTKEKEALAHDLLEVREVMLIPGQRLQWEEKVTKEAVALGVVALFRAPAAQRWKFAFNATQVEKTGITLGFHACAMSVTAGVLVPDSGLTNIELLSPAQCS
jgi:type VI secretion system protein VasD